MIRRCADGVRSYNYAILWVAVVDIISYIVKSFQWLVSVNNQKVFRYKVHRMF